MKRFVDTSMKPPFGRKTLYKGPRLKSEIGKSVKRGVIGLKKNITKVKKKPLTMPQKKQLTMIQKQPLTAIQQMLKRLGVIGGGGPKAIGARMRPRKGKAVGGLFLK